MQNVYKKLDCQEIIKIIPHRYPFLLIDKVEIFEDKKSARGIKCVTANELYFHGHFPQKPIMPGVLILEAMAQTTATLMITDENLKGKFAYFAGVNKARFRKQVVPGDVLEIYVNIEKIKSGIAKVKGVAKVRSEIVCDAELMFAVE